MNATPYVMSATELATELMHQPFDGNALPAAALPGCPAQLPCSLLLACKRSQGGWGCCAGVPVEADGVAPGCCGANRWLALSLLLASDDEATAWANAVWRWGVWSEHMNS